jgi:hypothetical protein
MQRVSQAWVKECPELEKFEQARGGGGGGAREDKTICLQGLNCLLGYKPWEYPLFTREDVWGFGKNATTRDRIDDEVIDAVEAGIC